MANRLVIKLDIVDDEGKALAKLDGWNAVVVDNVEKQGFDIETVPLFLVELSRFTQRFLTELVIYRGGSRTPDKVLNVQNSSTSYEVPQTPFLQYLKHFDQINEFYTRALINPSSCHRETFNWKWNILACWRARRHKGTETGK